MLTTIKRWFVPLAMAFALTAGTGGAAFAATNPDGTNGANKAEAGCLGILASYNQAFNYSVSDAVAEIQAAAANGDTTSGQIVSELAQTTPPDPSLGLTFCLNYFASLTGT